MIRVSRIIAVTVIFLICGTVFAETIGHVDTRFKLIGPDDKIVVEAFDDPGVAGLTCYLSRAKTGGLSGAVGVAEDTSDASISCLQTAPVDLAAARWACADSKGYAAGRCNQRTVRPGRKLARVMP